MFWLTELATVKYRSNIKSAYSVTVDGGLYSMSVIQSITAAFTTSIITTVDGSSLVYGFSVSSVSAFDPVTGVEHGNAALTGYGSHQATNMWHCESQDTLIAAMYATSMPIIKRSDYIT